ncbi:MAG: hypothetical protein ACRD39_03615 [Nitrososphaeraceae archaeon]
MTRFRYADGFRYCSECEKYFGPQVWQKTGGKCPDYHKLRNRPRNKKNNNNKKMKAEEREGGGSYEIPLDSPLFPSSSSIPPRFI